MTAEMCIRDRNKSVVFMPTMVLKLSHVILGRPTPLFPSTFPSSMAVSYTHLYYIVKYCSDQGYCLSFFRITGNGLV